MMDYRDAMRAVEDEVLRRMRSTALQWAMLSIAIMMGGATAITMLWLLGFALERGFLIAVALIDIMPAFLTCSMFIRCIRSARRIRAGVFGSTEREARLVGDTLAQVQREIRFPGPDSEEEKKARVERVREVLKAVRGPPT